VIGYATLDMIGSDCPNMTSLTDYCSLSASQVYQIGNIDPLSSYYQIVRNADSSLFSYRLGLITLAMRVELSTMTSFVFMMSS
jgi:hypothetical protein